MGVAVLVQKGVTLEVQWVNRQDLISKSDVLITVNDVLCPGVDLLGIGIGLP